VATYFHPRVSIPDEVVIRKIDVVALATLSLELTADIFDWRIYLPGQQLHDAAVLERGATVEDSGVMRSLRKPSRGSRTFAHCHLALADTRRPASLAISVLDLST